MNNIEYITSISNNRIKYIKSLHRKKNRESEGLFIIEGIKIIEESIEKKYSLELLVMSNKFFEDVSNADFVNMVATKDLDILYVDDRVFKEISDTESPQGILGLSKKVDREIKDFSKRKDGFYLILDEVQDPGNMGTIIRTADAFGIDGIFLGEGCVDLHNPKVVRATMGSIFRTPLYHIDDFDGFKEMVKGMDIFATSLEESKEIYNVSFKNSMLIIGNESKGVSKEYRDIATEFVKIPMIGEAESLNAAVASSVIMYEAMRQRNA